MFDIFLCHFMLHYANMCNVGNDSSGFLLHCFFLFVCLLLFFFFFGGGGGGGRT